MKKLRFILPLLFLIGCVEGVNNPREPQLTIPEAYACYDSTNDITDSLILMFEDIKAKEFDFNRSKFKHNCTLWDGKSIYLNGLVVDNIEGKTIYFLFHEKKHTLGWQRIVFHIDVETIAEAASYEVGQIVSVKGVISTLYNTVYEVDYLFQNYSIKISCGTI